MRTHTKNKSWQGYAVASGGSSCQGDTVGHPSCRSTKERALDEAIGNKDG
jgi:hypothetical protein